MADQLVSGGLEGRGEGAGLGNARWKIWATAPAGDVGADRTGREPHFPDLLCRND
jgi:hypothetical protein